jgi:ribosomal protein S30
MTPDIINGIIKKHFPNLHSKPRSNPDGWSYYYGSVVKAGKNSNRIFRAVSQYPNQDAKIKLSISFRIRNRDEFTFAGSESELVDIITDEIRFYEQLVES